MGVARRKWRSLFQFLVVVLTGCRVAGYSDTRGDGTAGENVYGHIRVRVYDEIKVGESSTEARWRGGKGCNSRLRELWTGRKPK